MICCKCGLEHTNERFLKDMIYDNLGILKGINPIYWFKIDDKVHIFCGPYCSNNFYLDDMKKPS